MKKFITLLAICCLSAGLMPSHLSAQMQLQTKKLKLSDFATKTTKVVLSGDDWFSISLREEVSRRWMASPFEFCSYAEYDRIKEDDSFYFLIPRVMQGRKQGRPSVCVLSLVKGGKEGEAIEVVSIPYAQEGFTSGRELVFLPAFLHIIQDFALDAMTSDKVSAKGLKGYTERKGKIRGKRVVVSEDDIAAGIRSGASQKYPGIEILPEDDADALMSEGAEGTIVSYTVMPADPVKGAVCYKYLISTDTYTLHHYAHHTIRGASNAGLLSSDLKAVNLLRNAR